MAFYVIFRWRSVPFLICKAGSRDLPKFEPCKAPMDLPKQKLLEVFDKIPPSVQRGEEISKGTRDFAKLRGIETINNKLLHRQFGVISCFPGYITIKHIQSVCKIVNDTLNTNYCFAIWRIEQPYKPVTRHGLGRKLGGGKGSIDHYACPVKMNRVILEVGGNYPEKAMMPVSQKMIDELEADKSIIRAENRNPYSWEFVIKNNILNCGSKMSRYDIEFSKYGPLVQ
ncbi:hypothetical protein GJ496_005403 [Pomphorhynchus laevis]|nr:hypothetical protein GJ496_005403 [Pomphorhynchus laevis]